MSNDQPELMQVLEKEFKELEMALEAPGPMSQELRKRVDSFTLRNLYVLVMRKTVTDTECAKRMSTCAGECEAKEKKAESSAPEKREIPNACDSVGIYLLTQSMKWVPTPVLLFVWMVGRGKNWW